MAPVTPSRPRIGLTTYWQQAQWGVWEDLAAIVPGTYVSGVAAAGGTPILLPPVGTDVSVLDVLDGLIVIGGVDVDPTNYGAAPHESTSAQPERDDHDLALTRAALDRGLPLFLICRGAQILNVALGGTLHQHIPDILPETRYQPAPGHFGEVELRAEPGSLIEGILGSRASVPVYHHQSIDQLAPGLRITATDAAGTVEAVESDPACGPTGWLLGVQFHPEQNPDDPRLLESFVAAARHHRLSTREQK